MRPAILLLIVICLTGLVVAAWADEPAPTGEPPTPTPANTPPAPAPAPAPTPPEPRFGFDLAAGYTALPMLDYGYRLSECTDHVQGCRTNDKSTLASNGMYGLSFGYYPPSDWVTLGLVVEGLFAQYRGELTGRADCPGSFTRTYQYDQRLTFYQLNGLIKIYFSHKSVRPFVELGLGALRIDAVFSAYHQTSYAATAVTGWGVEWRLGRRFGVSVQARAADHFGVVFHFTPRADQVARIDAQYVFISALVKTHFYF
jgi:hypothetical protein